MERDLVIARNVFDLTHDNVSINHTSFTRRGKKKKEGRTVQIPEALNSLTDSGSPSTAPSFSYANSSAIFEDTTPSAVSRQIQSRQKKKKKVVRLWVRSTRTGTFAEAARRYGEASTGGWDASSKGRDAGTGRSEG